MRIAFDGRTADPAGAGVGQYGLRLLTALRAGFPDHEFVELRPKGRSIPFVTSHLLMRREYLASRADLVHVPGGAPPIGYRGPYVITVHDLLIYRHPERFPRGQWFSIRVGYPSAIRNAALCIVPSAETKRELQWRFGLGEDRIAIIPHGVKVPATSAAPREGRYLLFIGTIEPRKNIGLLIAAYCELMDGNPSLRGVGLRIAGAMGWSSEEVMAEIDRARSAGYDVTYLGRVHEPEKWGLLAGAAAFVFPSFDEGFGMPVLEAMAAGTPVLASDIPVLREVGADAIGYFDPHSRSALAGTLREVVMDEKTAGELRRKGKECAAGFSWERTARETFAAYRRALGA